MNMLAHDIEVINEDGKTIYYNIIVDGDELEVTFKNNEGYIDEYNRGYFTSEKYKDTIRIPENVYYEENVYRVTRIGEYSFCYGNKNIYNRDTSHELYILMPNSIKSIGIYAFAGRTFNGWWSSNGTIHLSESLETIEDYAFYKCGIDRVFIPNSVVTIGDFAFDEISINSLFLGNSVNFIGKGAFKGNNIESISSSNITLNSGG